ncbi:YigZ family protein [Shewanella dokdonensis]|uniref:YigZ family protein n=1 Tax=Shewanella dokdonensis TaxID=712036 RepID=A0ABX8DII3_9GAMM|nr:YigZ family protein [Shewanella dokdonensis]MCL1076317.1 YigZ family protein [Shewanella dokdonensis]QVK24495.1 YigZ family protein [Shewanella dokdonensis]
MADSYPIPEGEVVFEEEIKHSRFITVLFHCPSAAVLRDKLAQLRVTYPAATHYCQAAIMSEPNDDVAVSSSDDGEPSGSAGRPMLAVLKGSGIGEVGVVVIRYFGGIELGVGGLVRAYSSGVQHALKMLSLTIKVKTVAARLYCGYAQLPDVEHYLSLFHVVIVERQFAENVSLHLAIPISAKGALAEKLQRISQGQLQLCFSDEAY